MNVGGNAIINSEQLLLFCKKRQQYNIVSKKHLKLLLISNR